MVNSPKRASESRRERPWVVVVADTGRAGQTYRVEAPDRVLRMFGMLSATRDELDLTTVPPEGRARVHQLLEVVSSELERSVSPALGAELRELVRRVEGVPGAGELRIEYASLLGWASGLVVAMLDQLAETRDQLYLTSEAAEVPACGIADTPDTAAYTAGALAFLRGGLLAGKLGDDVRTTSRRPRSLAQGHNDSVDTWPLPDNLKDGTRRADPAGRKENRPAPGLTAVV